MLFSGVQFLYYFLSAVLILYFISPRKLKNTVLLVSSLIFYGWGEPKYVVLMIASVVIGYISARIIEAKNNLLVRRVVLIVSVTVLLGFLGYFKYADFFISNFNQVSGMEIPLLKIALPIGISFYTFQILSYVVDVYRGDVNAQKNIINLATYITMFPQLIAGPIVRYIDIVSDITERKHTFAGFSLGVRRFVIGLSKKVLIANVLGELCDIIKTSNDMSVIYYWMYAVCIALQIYFDFSGYSDMAIGLGRIFGFKFPENFNYPFIAKNITEFWRRWHMSLGAWFRDYVYIPLGGNRVSKPRWFLNIFIVWMLTGFWHGAAWNFIAWGLFFAVFLCVERLFLLKWLDGKKIISRIYIVVTLAISFIIFDTESVQTALLYIRNMFGMGGVPFVSEESIYYMKSYAIPLIIGIVGATPAVKLITGKINEKVRNVLEPVVLLLLVTVVTAFLVDGSFNPFLYFRF